MPHYDYVLKKSKTKTVHEERYESCYSSIFNRINKVSRISIYAFPEGGISNRNKLGTYASYGHTSEKKLLKTLDKPRKKGVQRWAEFLASFIPGTSFILNSDKRISLDILYQKNVPVCEFRLEDSLGSSIHPLFKQIWVTAVRYSWEDDMPKIVRFCLNYWKPSMEPYQAFQLFLLAHEIIGEREHACYAQNPKYFTKDEYEKLFFTKHEPRSGTRYLSKGIIYNKFTYKIEKTPLNKIVKKASKIIESKTKIKKIIPLRQILKEYA